MKILKTYGETANAAENAIRQIERRGATNTAKVDDVVHEILDAVRSRGDAALREYAERFDALAPGQSLRVTREEMQAAWESLGEELKAAMRMAQANIRIFAEKQLPRAFSFRPSEGMEVGQVIRPLVSVGCYVPGGRYPLPSTLLMTTTPAQVAGVERIVVCSPKPAQETLAAAHLVGVTEFYRIGGAQAIAALAYGTESIESVDKIVGPGNIYVTAAKSIVSLECGIDMPAGPTEIVVTTEHGDPDGVAADLVAQAEHDPEALAVLITPNEELAEAVVLEVKRQVQGNAIAEQSIAAQGYAFVTQSPDEARELTNRLAPEHLTVDSGADLRWVKNAGSVFVGNHTPQSMGDYISGPNHVLPTGRNGRVRGGLSVLDFIKVITVQQYTLDALRVVGPHAITLAEAEGLKGHADSVRVRMR
ncbi:histidinol dehydrogenase [Bryocella elongata]|uniref:Histidinol dehydrogenase n=1 Tax=Bryocella elongata TaxID=863522 RepID=A0A1H5WD35_9BACT|nr:histidinol dehydrogenase [Bryocella elongata]SEF97362.1 histidinol dehydrogenase [Bryocella elongata]